MKWFLMLLIFVSGVYYLVSQHKRETRKKEMVELAKKDQLKTLEEPPLPNKTQKVYLMKFSLQTIKTLRGLTQDANEKVRFAAAELLWQLQDESAPAVIRAMFENETEQVVKKQLIDMLAKDKSKLSLALLGEALKDYDRETRLQAIEAIGNFCSKEAIISLNKSLEDYDEEVRLKSLEAVNRIRRDIEAHKEQQLREIENKPLFRIE
ncbi:MAG: HEAT repeat domain-containing protein [Elusimicrobiales bacterium]|nr:HEAT repeat domain-containing protein [Elusimicrobiales bacterium]